MMYQFEIERQKELQEQIKSGKLCKEKTFSDHRYIEKYKVYNAPNNWNKWDAISFCDPGAFPSSTAQKYGDVWFVECCID